MSAPGFEITEAQFLAGPHRGWDDLDVDDIFAKPFSEVVDDWSADSIGEPGHGRELEALLLSQPIDSLDFPTPDPVTIVTVPDPACGVAAICEGRLVGLYVGSDLVVHEDFRRRGIGTCLVIERFSRFGCLPNWDLDVPAYSRAGLETHRFAFKLLLSIAGRQPDQRDQGPTP